MANGNSMPLDKQLLTGALAISQVAIVHKKGFVMVNLIKGQRIDLHKSLDNVLIGLGWQTNKYAGNYDFDLDASVFLLGENDKVRNDADFIFYNNLTSVDGSVRHTGDNLVGGDGNNDDEVITIKLSQVPINVHKIVVTVTIYDAEIRKQNFGLVSNAYVRLASRNNESDMTGMNMLRFDLQEAFSTETAVVVCELYRHNKTWGFTAVGSGYNGGLHALCQNYGVNV